MTTLKIPDNLKTDDECLEFIMQQYILLFPQTLCNNCDGKYYRIRTRKTYACKCGSNISPCAKTIFYKSSRPLKDWFMVFNIVKGNPNISTPMLTNITGIKHKSTWYMKHQIMKAIRYGTIFIQKDSEASRS